MNCQFRLLQKNGERLCKRKAVKGSIYCFQHQETIKPNIKQPTNEVNDAQLKIINILKADVNEKWLNLKVAPTWWTNQVIQWDMKRKGWALNMRNLTSITTKIENTITKQLDKNDAEDLLEKIRKDLFHVNTDLKEPHTERSKDNIKSFKQIVWNAAKTTQGEFKKKGFRLDEFDNLIHPSATSDSVFHANIDHIWPSRSGGLLKPPIDDDQFMFFKHQLGSPTYYKHVHTLYKNNIMSLLATNVMLLHYVANKWIKRDKHLWELDLRKLHTGLTLYDMSIIMKITNWSPEECLQNLTLTNLKKALDVVDEQWKSSDSQDPLYYIYEKFPPIPPDGHYVETYKLQRKKFLEKISYNLLSVT